MDFAGFRMPVSTRLQLTVVGRDYKRYPCDAQLLGFRAGQSVLLYLPKKPPQVMLYDGMDVEVKAPLQSGIVSFSSSILRLCPQPFPYLHISYPERCALEPLRQFPRFALDAPLSALGLSSNGVTVSRLDGRFCDISLQGARIRLPKELGDAATRVGLRAEVNVAGMVHTMELRGDIRRVFGRDDKEPELPFAYGIAFETPPPPQRLLLLALCQELQSGHGLQE